jgi:hypothetical protein
VRGKEDCISVVHILTDIFYTQLLPRVEPVAGLILFKNSYLERLKGQETCLIA